MANTTKAPVKGKVVANLASADGTIFAVSREGWIQTYLCRSGELKSTASSGKRLESTPLLTADSMYVGSVEGQLMAYSLF